MTTRIAGCDLGKSSAVFVSGTIADDGKVTFDEPSYVPHEGKPFEVFRDWYEKQQIHRCVALGATGVYAPELAAPVIILPEDSCQEAALARVEGLPAAVNVVSVGARGYGVLSRFETKSSGNGQSNGHGSTDRRLQVRYLENDKCSSGTGENIQRMARRFGFTVAQADQLASTAEGELPITARCSVFAKSEMTHYANQGKSTADLFAGFFASVARNTGALLARTAVDGPVLLIGGCAQLGSFRRAFEAHLGQSVTIPDNFLAFEALGAAYLAAEAQLADAAQPLPEDLSALFLPRKKRFTELAPAQDSQDAVSIMDELKEAVDWQTRPSIMGLDLGSTGAKLVLSCVETGEPLLDLYDRTRGNPVDAARRLVATMLERGRPQVRAIGLTGSGREAVATLARAVFAEDKESPEHKRVVVLNEIVAHATAAMRCDPDQGKDLTVIEIGGQDAKYIRLLGGRIVESDMNKACSAGTGSFLEEQAQFYDVNDISAFVELAKRAERPPDLGQMCTVYVADAAAEALKDGFELGDIFAGFQYSVIHNYLDRVMGQRTLGERVFFQGKPASNPSLAWTLAAITGRQITVPPNPGAMGAWGIGLCAAESNQEVLLAAPPLDLTQLLTAEIADRSEFRCRDKECQTLCPIERTTIVVNGQERTALSGGACPKFEVAAQSLPKLQKDAPNPFEERARLIDAFAVERPGARQVAIPYTGPLVSYMPWLATVISELGCSVSILRTDGKSLARGEQLCNSFDSCGPAKIAHAICDTDIGLLFFPKILDIGDPVGPGGQACVTEQSMPEMVEQSLLTRKKPTRVLRPRLSFLKNRLDGAALHRSLSLLTDELGVSSAELAGAITKAAVAQREFEQALLAAGDGALRYAEQHGLPAVVVCGSLHVIHDRAINATIPQLLRQNGVMAIPMDGLKIPAEIAEMPKVYWGDANRYLRAAAAARAKGNIFPLMLSSFGCGPASFTEQVFQSLLEGYPHTILESDGHGGTAGFVTRIQAFLRSVEQFIAEDGQAELPDNQRAIDYVEPADRTRPYLDRDARYVFLSSVDYLGPLFAAVYRSYGYDAIAAPELSSQNFACGRRDCSGKECLSYQMVWGSFRQYLDENPPPAGKETRLVQVSGQSCRAGLFGVKDKISLDKIGLGDRVNVIALKMAGGPGMSIRLWAGICAVDILRQLYLYHQVAQKSAGDAEALYRRYADQVITLIEKPSPRGLRNLPQLGFDWFKLRGLLERASRDFAAMERANAQPTKKYRTVFVSGDMMTKGNDFANGGVYRMLAERDVRVVVEPAGDFLEFLARAQPHLLFGRSASAGKKLLYRLNMVAIRKELYGMVKKLHAWLPMPDIPAALERTGEVLDPKTNGGAALVVGSVLHHWDQGDYDGVMLTACWGCDNGLVGESLLRHQKQIPTYYFYDDGTPLDERRLSSFTFRLHKETARGPRLRPKKRVSLKETLQRSLARR